MKFKVYITQCFTVCQEIEAENEEIARELAENIDFECFDDPYYSYEIEEIE